MEKRKANLTIEDFEDKKYGEGKTAGRYTRFKTTEEGWISSFDKPTIEKLKDAEGRCVSVEVMTDKNDKEKITKFLGDAEESNDDEVEDHLYAKKQVPESAPRKSVKGSAYEKDPVGLAVEVFCATMGSVELAGMDDESTKQIMDMSIDLVKKAQKGFE